MNCKCEKVSKALKRNVEAIDNDRLSNWGYVKRTEKNTHNRPIWIHIHIDTDFIEGNKNETQNEFPIELNALYFIGNISLPYFRIQKSTRFLTNKQNEINMLKLILSISTVLLDVSRCLLLHKCRICIQKKYRVNPSDDVPDDSQ